MAIFDKYFALKIPHFPHRLNPDQLRGKMKKNGSLVFIGLALGITWVLWIPALVLGFGKGLSPANHRLPAQSSFVRDRQQRTRSGGGAL